MWYGGLVKDKPWCPTEVDDFGLFTDELVQKGQWGHCALNCPNAVRTGDLVLSIMIIKCDINIKYVLISILIKLFLL